MPQSHQTNGPAAELRMHGPHAQVFSLHTDAGSRKYLDETERLRFMRAAIAAELPLRTLCLTLMHTGCRLSEALALTPASLHVHEGVIAFRTLKKRSKRPIVREVPVPRDLLQDLVDLAQERAGESEKLWSWGRCRAWQLIKEVMATAVIPPGPHATAKGLRHAFGLHAVRSGVPLNFVQRWLGHASMSTTAIYLQATGPDERDFAARMWSGHERN